MKPPGATWSWLLPLLVGCLAFAARWASVADVGGLHALLGYDEGVYMGAATAFVHGLLPYRDFTLVHPPGSTVLLAPFAELGRVTSESTSWAIARVFVMVIGAVNAALITVIARRVSMTAAVVAGPLYALWGPVVHVERTTMLEGFVLAGLVIALVALRRPQETVVRAVIAGAALGLGTSVKLWGAVPLVVIIVWLLASRAWRTAVIVLGSALVVFSAVVVPFLSLTGWRMVQLVLLAQLGRGDGGTAVLDRPERFLSMDGTLGARGVTGVTALPHALVWSAATVVLLAAVLAAWRRPAARLWSLLLGVQVLVLLAVPVYFAGYSSFIGPALVLVLGAGVDVAVHDPPFPALRWVTRAAAVAVAVLFAWTGATHIFNDGDSIRGIDPVVARQVSAATCVSSDSSGVLVLYDALGRSIDAGCGRPLIDVDGTVYAVQPDNPNRLSSTARRRASAAYQRALRTYFGQGDLVLIHRAPADVLDQQTVAQLTAKGMTLESRGLRVFGTPVGAPADTQGAAPAG